MNDSIDICFIGEIMLGREVGQKFSKNKYKIVSSDLRKDIEASDYVLANLEAPISDTSDENDIMTFVAKSEILEEVKFVDAFSLANNHINDAGCIGIEDTIKALEKDGFIWNGFYETEYEPIIFEKNDIKCAIICCTDVLNKDISDEDFNKNLLWLDDSIIDKTILEYKSNGYFVLLYVHGGIMFSRYPNPPFRSLLHSKIDLGVDSIVTVHPHVLGCSEIYSGKRIFYSLGDFIMDGHSDRRRKAAILKLKITKDHKIDYQIIPTYISNDLSTEYPNKSRTKNIYKSWNSVSKLMSKNSKKYEFFYKKKFKGEILNHIASTLLYQIKNKSLLGFTKLLFTRAKDFKNMGRWMIKDTSKMRNNLEDETML